jgi:hypothetical protein
MIWLDIYGHCSLNRNGSPPLTYILVYDDQLHKFISISYHIFKNHFWRGTLAPKDL